MYHKICNLKLTNHKENVKPFKEVGKCPNKQKEIQMIYDVVKSNTNVVRIQKFLGSQLVMNAGSKLGHSLKLCISIFFN